MNISSYDFVHLAMYAMGSEIRGKTKFQKTIYFLGILTRQSQDLGYRAHFYGPFSSKVANALGRLEALRFVDSSTVSWGTDSRGFERSRTDYKLNEAGQRVAEEKSKEYSELWERMTLAAKSLNSARTLDYMKLSIAAKTFFLLEGKAVSITELTKIAEKFGWQVSQEETQEAAEFLESLNLVELSRT